MQLLGVLGILGVIAIGFQERHIDGISYFDPHALLIILGGSLSATMIGSKSKDLLRTFSHLAELVGFLRPFHKETQAIEKERVEFEKAWIEGRRSEALGLAQNSQLETTRMMLEQVLGRARPELVENRFLALSHKISENREGAIHNWELMSKLGPSFGIVGTITGMVQMFKSFGAANSNVGTTLSLALLATLYGISFGAAIASPIMTYLQKLYYERLNVLDRCQTSVNHLCLQG